MTAIDLSLLPMTARVTDNGSTAIGNVDLLAIAKEYGTPVFVYDTDHLKFNCRKAVDLFGNGVAYATKAFLCKMLARLAYDCGMSLDVSTEGEYCVAKAAGVPASKLVLHGNNKSSTEVERAILEGVQWIVLDSFDDIALVSGIAEKLQQRVRVLIRINPGVEVHAHRYVATGNRESKFGIPMWTGDAEIAVRQVRANALLEFLGLHMHVGSLVFSIDSFLAALRSVLSFVKAVDPEFFVVGGGLGVRYLGEDTAVTLEEWAKAILDYCHNEGIRAKILAEPGRSIVASAAVTLYTVGSVTTKGAQTYVAVDGGMSDNPRPIIYDSGYEVFMPSDPRGDRDLVVSVVGRHCESGDTLVRDGLLPSKVSIGDIICTPVTGAYGYSMASNYNMMTRPPVVFVSGGSARLSIRRETIDDLMLRDLG